MRQQTETYHVLEMRRGPEVFHKPTAGMFRPAELLAYQGRIIEALEAAERIQIECYGRMDGITFRVVSKTTTVSMLGSWEGFRE